MIFCGLFPTELIFTIPILRCANTDSEPRSLGALKIIIFKKQVFPTSYFNRPINFYFLALTFTKIL